MTHPADGPTPHRPANPFGLALVLVFYATSIVLLAIGVLRLLDGLT